MNSVLEIISMLETTEITEGELNVSENNALKNVIIIMVFPPVPRFGSFGGHVMHPSLQSIVYIYI